jgi:hypothetical protein
MSKVSPFKKIVFLSMSENYKFQVIRLVCAGVSVSQAIDIVYSSMLSRM